MSAYMEAKLAQKEYEAGLITAEELAFWEAGARYEAEIDDYTYDDYEEEDDAI